MSRRAREQAAWERHQTAHKRNMREMEDLEAQEKAKETARFQGEQPRRDRLRAKALRDTKGWTGEYKSPRKKKKRR